MPKLWEKFFNVDPWKGFVPLPNPNNSGWHVDHSAFQVATAGSKLVVEVGSWKGASAITMLKHMQNFGTEDPAIICVDTWLGGVEHWDKKEIDTLAIKNGRPDLYLDFMSNIANAGFSENVVPLPQTSSNAAKILLREKIWADTIYIDGSHEYNDVIRDLRDYFPLLAEEGVMFGDDLSWPGVGRAVKEFAEETGVAPMTMANNFFFFTRV